MNWDIERVALSGANSDQERESAFERLAMNAENATDEIQPLDYIFSVDILNEGVDIVEVNQGDYVAPYTVPYCIYSTAWPRT